MKKIDGKEVKRFFSELRRRLGGVSNLYIKVVLTLIMIALFMIAFRLPNTRNDYIGVDAYVHGRVDADVSGSVDTYEQNNRW